MGQLICRDCFHRAVTMDFELRREVCARKASQRLDPVNGLLIISGATRCSRERKTTWLDRLRNTERCGPDGLFHSKRVAPPTEK